MKKIITSIIVFVAMAFAGSAFADDNKKKPAPIPDEFRALTRDRQPKSDSVFLDAPKGSRKMIAIPRDPLNCLVWQ